MLLIFGIIAIILAIPFLLLFGFFNVAANSFESFGLAPGMAIVILLGMLIGSFINIPIGKRRLVGVEERRFFGLVRSSRMQS